MKVLSTLGPLLVALTSTPAFSQALDAEPKNITWVGFQQSEDTSRVYVRTSEKASYKVDSSRDNMVVLIIENARVVLHNNTRPLFTRFFAGPVLSIVARPVEEPSASVSVEIRLRRKVPFDVSQQDTMVALDFRHE